MDVGRALMKNCTRTKISRNVRVESTPCARSGPLSVRNRSCTPATLLDFGRRKITFANSPSAVCQPSCNDVVIFARSSCWDRPTVDSSASSRTTCWARPNSTSNSRGRSTRTSPPVGLPSSSRCTVTSPRSWSNASAWAWTDGKTSVERNRRSGTSSTINGNSSSSSSKNSRRRDFSCRSRTTRDNMASRWFLKRSPSGGWSRWWWWWWWYWSGLVSRRNRNSNDVRPNSTFRDINEKPRERRFLTIRDELVS